MNDIAPQFTSGGAVTVNENIIATGYVAAASDAEGDPVSFAIAGGADAALFAIDATTGALSFVSAPDFEAGQTSFTVDISASDGTNSSTRTVVVTLADVNDNSPVFTSGTAASAAENQTSAYAATATDADAGTTLAFSLSGTDAALFDIDAATGVVTFKAAPDFEAPTDANGDNVYHIVVTASDGANSANRAVAITITNANDNAPVFTSGTTASASENQTAAYIAAATDADAGATLAYSLSGTDAAQFDIDAATGAVTFKTATDFEACHTGGNNVYDVIVTANDGTNSTNRAVAIAVTNVNEAPAITSGNSASVAENQLAAYDADATDPEGAALSFSLSGTDAALFDIDAATGLVTFKVPPNLKPLPMQAATIFTTSSSLPATGSESTNQAVAITVTDVDPEGPVFTSGSSASVSENGPPPTPL